MDLIIGETQLKCYEDGRIERLHKKYKKWKEVKGSINKVNGYLTIGINKKMILYHRIIYKAFHTNWDLNSQSEIDHINRDKKDNRIENLRAITHQKNSFNTNAVGYTPWRNGFKAYIKLNGKSLSKCFATEDEAKEWYLHQKAILHVI